MQVVIHLVESGTMRLLLPPAEAPVLNSIAWGRHDELGSPAYWAAQAWMWELDEPEHYRLGRTLREELLACMLGGYGIPAEVGLARYRRLRPSAADALGRLCDEAYIRTELSRPASYRRANSSLPLRQSEGAIHIRRIPRTRRRRRRSRRPSLARPPYNPSWCRPKNCFLGGAQFALQRRSCHTRFTLAACRTLAWHIR